MNNDWWGELKTEERDIVVPKGMSEIEFWSVLQNFQKLGEKDIFRSDSDTDKRILLSRLKAQAISFWYLKKHFSNEIIWKIKEFLPHPKWVEEERRKMEELLTSFRSLPPLFSSELSWGELLERLEEDIVDFPEEYQFLQEQG